MKRVAKDKYNQEIKNGDIIDIHQTVNGCQYFVVIDLDKLDVRYYDNNHQGVGFDTWVAIDRKYEYDVEELLDMKPGPFGFIESENEVVGRLSEDELLQTQIGSRSGVDLSEEDVKTIIETNENPPEPNEKLKEAFKTYNERSVEWLENKWNNYDLNTGKSGFRLYLKQVLSKQKKTYTEEDVIFMVNKMVEYYMFVTQVPIQMNLINGFLKDNYGFFKDEE